MNQKEIAKQLMFLEQKYEQAKEYMHQQKLLEKLTTKDLEQFINLMNIIAMKYSKLSNHKAAIEWLRKTIKYTDSIPKAKAITFNNLACVYREEGNLPMALLYISKAQRQADSLTVLAEHQGIDFEKGFKVVTDCSLNLCAILSSMKEHYKALKAVRKGLELLEESKNNQKIPLSYYSSLYPIMKYNQGVELEQIKMYPAAIISYKEALKLTNAESEIHEKINLAISQLQKLFSKIKQKKSENNYFSARGITIQKQSIEKQASRNALSSRNRIHGLNYLGIQLVKKQKKARKNSQFFLGDQENNENFETIGDMVSNAKNCLFFPQKKSKLSYHNKRKFQLEKQN